jgi:hypothetical protein
VVNALRGAICWSDYLRWFLLVDAVGVPSTAVDTI